MTSPTWKTRAKLAIRATLTVLVLAFVGRHVARTWREVHERGQGFHVAPAWFAASVALYLLGLACFAVFFWRLMTASATPTRLYPAFRAYLVSHLGKYVPGKAMVVVIRAGLVVPFGARPATAAFATLYETLTMMAAGCFLLGPVALLGGPVPSRQAGEGRSPIFLVGFAAFPLFLLVVWPTVFPILARLASTPLRGVGPDAVPRLSARLLAEGLAWSTLGWVLLGLSQVAVIRAMGTSLPASAWPLAIASVALATVAGFAVPISPGGLGVREFVLWTALGEILPQDRAVASALVLRLSWIVGEVVAGGLGFLIRPKVAGGGLAPP